MRLILLIHLIRRTPRNSTLANVAESNFTHHIDKHISRINNVSGHLKLPDDTMLGRSDWGRGDIQQGWNKAINTITRNVTTFVKSVWANSSPKITPAVAFSILAVLASNPQPEILQPSYLQVHFQTPRSKENQITGINGGFDRVISIEYEDGSSFPGASIPGSGSYPVIPHLHLGELVKSVKTEYSTLLSNTDSYSYSDSRIWQGTPENAAMLGFKSKSVSSSLSGVSRTEEYDHSSNLLAGTVLSSMTKNGIGEIKQTSSSVYTVQYPLGKPSVVMSSSSESIYQNGSVLLTSNQSTSYDGYGNIASKTMAAAGSTVTETTIYDYDTSRWILNRPNGSVKELDGVLLEKSTISYSGDTGMTVTGMVGTVAEATSIISLDSNGNQRSVTDALGRTTSFEYDSVVHNYVTKVKNPKGFELVKTYDTATGAELTITDPNGGVMTKKYDEKGRLFKITPPGSESYVEKYLYTDYALGNANGFSTQ